ncbi:MAG: sugar transferase [Bacteroidaceae bacterium]|nr:sugar transferase [Bacteroidaceae bacterium]
MNKSKANISMRRTTRHWLRESLTLLVEALIWIGCLYLTVSSSDQKQSQLLLYFAINLVPIIIATRLIPNNAYSRTARRDEVVACAMKTALAVSILVFAINRYSYPLLLACLLFCVALTIERLILNSWFIRYSLRHNENGVIICDENTVWQQKALQQNTYGLKLARLEEQTAQQLEAYLTEHPETESVYCSPTALPAKEFEDVAHTCRKQGVVLNLLPQPVYAMSKAMQSECRGNVNVLSPAKLPLQSIFNRTIKRLTDIVLSLLVLLTVFPVFAIIAYVCIKRQSRGPVLMAQHMCGMDGKTFLCLTFRTRHYEAAPSFLEGINDPGYFPFGKFLTLSRLELLPQFLCVLWGSMTIVGSQIMQPDRYPDYRRELRQYFVSSHRLKAGITSHHFASQTQGSTKADVWYYRNWGFWLDIRIMIQRLGTLLKQSKAKSINYI